MSDWIVTIAKRQAGLEPGFQGADETHEDFQARLAADEEIVLGLTTQSAGPSTLPDTWAPASYLPGPERVTPSAEAPVAAASTSPTTPVDAPSSELPAPPVPPAPGWWLANDGQWYPPLSDLPKPPETATDAPPAPDASTPSS